VGRICDRRSGLRPVRRSAGQGRLAATGALTAVAALGLLVWHSGWWTLLALAPLGIAVLAYTGAVRAAIAYGAAVHAAFDLHRFDLLRALHLTLPKDRDAEQASNRALSDFLRQGVPVPFSYRSGVRRSTVTMRGGQAPLTSQPSS